MKKLMFQTSAAWQVLALATASVATMAVATPAAAQDYTRGTLVGTVVDDKGVPISGAQVTVTSNEQGYASTVTTDANGTFRVPALATGPYTVVIRRDNAVIVEDRGANVLAGQSNTFSYTAGTAATATAGADQNLDDGVVVVTGTRVQVNDFASTQTGATLDVAELAQTVPVSRSQTALILLAPGTVSGDGGFGDLASIGGATIAENAYYVNGLNITDFRTFVGGSLVPFEFYRTLDVKTGGYQAEYGRALGGVTSAVTKSGSNEFQAGAVVTFNSNNLRSNSPDTYLAYNESDYRQSVDGNFYVSGPIIKDRLFVYGLYSPRFFKNGDSSFSTGQRVVSTADTPFYGLKVDGIIAEGHRVEGTFFRDAQDQTTDFFRFDRTTLEEGALIGTTKSKFGGNNFIGTYTGKFSDFLTLSAAYGVNKNVGTSQPSPNVAFITSQINPPTGLTSRTVQGFSATQFADKDKREVYRADADVYVNLLGEHHFRAGFDYEKLTASEATFRSGGGYDYVFVRPVAGRPNGYIQRTFYANEGEFKTNQRAFYLQDSYSTFGNRLNFQIGVRNDRFENFSVEGDKYYDSKSLWAPRLGASFDVFGDKRTKLNAFWGRYYLPIATNTNIRLGGAELFYRQRFEYPAGQGPFSDLNRDGIPDGLTFDANGDVTNLGAAFGSSTCPAAGPNGGQTCFSILSDGIQGPTDTLVSSNLKPSSTDEFILGASHRFGSWTVGVDYVRRRLKETLEDAAIDAAVLAYCDANGVAGCDDVFTGFHQYVLINPGSDVNVRLDGDCTVPGQCDVVTLKASDLGYPKAVRKYDAVQLTVDKAFNGFYGFNASYVWTKLRGNFEGAVKSDNNQTDAGLTQDFDQPGFLDGADGDLANGRRHAFKVYGHVQPVKWLDIGVNARLESPRKFSCIGNYFDENNFAAAYGSASYYCTIPTLGGTPVPNSAGGTSYLINRGEGLKSDWLKNVDLGLAVDLSEFSEMLGTGFGNSQIRVDVFNVFNSKAKIDLQEFGDRANFVYEPNPNFGRTTGYQAPRSVRLQLAFRFGKK